MNPFEQRLGEKETRKTIENSIETIRKNLAIDPLEETLERLLKIFAIDTLKTEQIPILQSKVAFLFENLMETWQKHGGTISDLRKEVDSFLESKNGVPDFFRYERSIQHEKKQPSIIESLRETLKRFETMERLEPVFVRDHKFHPGIYQNFILPLFFVFHDRNGDITDKIYSFKMNIQKHIHDTYPGEDTESVMLKSHTRNKVFPETLSREMKG